MTTFLGLARKLVLRTCHNQREVRAARAGNVGPDLIEWPERAAAAAELLRMHAGGFGPGTVVADWGCGRQTVRPLLPAAWRYIPFDRLRRSDDTVIHDFDDGPPPGSATVVICLGLLEYLRTPWRTLGAAIEQSELCVFSYVGPATAERRRKNGWRWAATFEEVDGFLRDRGATKLAHRYSPMTGAVYLVGRRAGCGGP